MDTKIREKITEQQKEALRFFGSQTKDWDDKAKGVIANKVNVIKQRNDYVLDVIKNRNKTEFVLDVGSGVGDLVCEVAKLGIKATGIDMAGGMVDLAHKRAVDNKLDLAEFLVTDYFDWHVVAESYDLIVANGFIEYISYEQRDNFFNDAYRLLKPGGSLVVSARNRLFNIISGNEYTRQEIEQGTVSPLVNEAMYLTSGRSLAELMILEPVELQPEKIQHAGTGIEVTTRYQYTPVQLMKMLAREGLIVKDLSPIHVHGMTTTEKEEVPELHWRIANLLQMHAMHNRKMLVMASAFMIHSKKK